MRTVEGWWQAAQDYDDCMLAHLARCSALISEMTESISGTSGVVSGVPGGTDKTMVFFGD